MSKNGGKILTAAVSLMTDLKDAVQLVLAEEEDRKQIAGEGAIK